MPAIYEHRHVVRDDETDGFGHANNVSFLHWMQAAAIAHSSAQGWTPQRYEDAGCGWVVRTHRVDYFGEAFAGQEILVRTWVAGFERITSLRRYRIVRPEDDTLLVRAETNWVFVNRQRRLPRRIPAELREAFEVVTPDDEPR